MRFGFGGVAGVGASAAMVMGLARCRVPEGPLDLAPDAVATTGGVCLGACSPDPGWGPIDCSPEQALDLFRIETFDDQPGTVGFVAQDWYTYTDGTAQILFSTYAGQLSDGGYQPPVEAVQVCRPDAGDGFANRILHAFGGPFNGWGGGMGMAMAKINGRERGSPDPGSGTDVTSPKSICFDGTSQTNGSPLCPHTVESAVQIGALDVSQYEGVSFWARRGPNSQAGIHVMVGDKYTDDDLNYLAQREQVYDGGLPDGAPQPLHCQRVRECDCLSHQACVTYPNGFPNNGIIPGAQYCTPPPSTAAQSTECTGGVTGGGVGPSNCCDQFECDQWDSPFPNDSLPMTGRFLNAMLRPMGDIQFAARPCTPYQWSNGVGGSFCFDPATDPPPAPSTEQCGDHWMTTVTLGTEWQYYVVPFANLRQEGWAQKSEHLDLTAVSVVRFTWDPGWIDYYIDSLSFYRHK